MSRRILLLLVGVTAVTLAISAAKPQRHTLRGSRLKVEQRTALSADTAAVRRDTIFAPDGKQIALRGYDKPLTSSHETLFATNHTRSRITGITLRIAYTDLSDRQLHERTVTIPADIPPGATRKLRFRSWDEQCSFYYHKSRQPRTPRVTPYAVKVSIVYAVTSTGDLTVEQKP